MSSGIFNHVGFGKESNYGVETAPTFYIPIRESDGMQIDMDPQFVEAIKGTAPKNKDSFNGKASVTGNFESDTYPNFIGHIFNSALGKVTSALVNGETEVYKHIFTEDTIKPSYTVEQKYGEIVKRYVGYIAKKISMECKAGDSFGFKFDGFAQNHVAASPTTPIYETTRTYNFKDVVNIKIGNANVTAQVEMFSMEYDNGLKGFYSMASNYHRSLYPGQSTCEGKMTLYLDDATKVYLEDYINSVKHPIEIIAEGDTIGASSKNTVHILIPKAKLTAIPTKLTFDYNELEIKFEAEEHPTDGILKVEIINSISSF